MGFGAIYEHFLPSGFICSQSLYKSSHTQVKQPLGGSRPLKEVAMNLIEKVKEVEAKYQQGNNIFRRVSVGFLLERISQLEQAAKQNVERTTEQLDRLHEQLDEIIEVGAGGE